MVRRARTLRKPARVCIPLPKTAVPVPLLAATQPASINGENELFTAVGPPNRTYFVIPIAQVLEKKRIEED